MGRKNKLEGPSNLNAEEKKRRKKKFGMIDPGVLLLFYGYNLLVQIDLRCIAWLLICHDSPVKHPRISQVMANKKNYFTSYTTWC